MGSHSKPNFICESLVMIGNVILFVGLTSFIRDISNEVMLLKRRIDELETRIESRNIIDINQILQE